MKKFITEVIYLLVVGLFLNLIWIVDIEKTGFIRWMVGWVIGVALLKDIWPLIDRKYLKN